MGGGYFEGAYSVGGGLFGGGGLMLREAYSGDGFIWGRLLIQGRVILHRVYAILTVRSVALEKMWGYRLGARNLHICKYLRRILHCMVRFLVWSQGV